MSRLRGLTLRGRGVLAAGVSASLCGLVLGQRDLLRIGVLLLVLPLLSLLLAARGGQRLAAARTTSPSRVPAGGSTRVRLDLSNPSRVPTGVLLAQDQLPHALGPAPRFVLDRLGPGRTTAVAYTVRPASRGRHRVGPLGVRVTDPLGLCEVPAQVGSDDPLLVLPRVEPLPAVTGPSGWSGAGEDGERSAVAAGEHGSGTREYAPGDDVRRVHWRSTARRGELMVRQDEQPRQQRATVVLDRRAQAHSGAGPRSSFERAVSAAASVAVSLAAAGTGVRVVSGERTGPWVEGPSAAAAGLLDDLADVQLGGQGDLAAALRAVAAGGQDGLVVAVLGRLDEGDLRLLARVPQRGTRAVALLLEGEGPRGRSPGAALRRAGWTVLDVGREGSLASAWTSATGAA